MSWIAAPFFKDEYELITPPASPAPPVDHKSTQTVNSQDETLAISQPIDIISISPSDPSAPTELDRLRRENKRLAEKAERKGFDKLTEDKLNKDIAESKDLVRKRDDTIRHFSKINNGLKAQLHEKSQQIKGELHLEQRLKFVRSAQDDTKKKYQETMRIADSAQRNLRQAEQTIEVLRSRIACLEEDNSRAQRPVYEHRATQTSRPSASSPSTTAGNTAAPSGPSSIEKEQAKRIEEIEAEVKRLSSKPASRPPTTAPSSGPSAPSKRTTKPHTAAPKPVNGKETSKKPIKGDSDPVAEALQKSFDEDAKQERRIKNLQRFLDRRNKQRGTRAVPASHPSVPPASTPKPTTGAPKAPSGNGTPQVKKPANKPMFRFGPDPPTSQPSMPPTNTTKPTTQDQRAQPRSRCSSFERVVQVLNRACQLGVPPGAIRWQQIARCAERR